MRIILAVLTLSCVWTPPALAQTLDSAARLTKPDDIVLVEDVDGRTIKGQLVALSETSIRLLTTPTAVIIPVDRVRRIDKLGDPVVDGFKRGALVFEPRQTMLVERDAPDGCVSFAEDAIVTAGEPREDGARQRKPPDAEPSSPVENYEKNR